MAQADSRRPIKLAVFMLVNTRPEWLGFSESARPRGLRDALEPLLARHAGQVSLRVFDIGFYSAHATDLWMWEAADHQAYERLADDLRDTPFRDRFFEIVEILPGVENAPAFDAREIASPTH